MVRWSKDKEGTQKNGKTRADAHDEAQGGASVSAKRWTEGKDDPDYEGSIFEKLGFDKRLCGRCGAHLKDGICLNGCHLSPATLRAFQEIMRQAKVEPKHAREQEPKV